MGLDTSQLPRDRVVVVPGLTVTVEEMLATVAKHADTAALVSHEHRCGCLTSTIIESLRLSDDPPSVSRTAFFNILNHHFIVTMVWGDGAGVQPARAYRAVFSGLMISQQLTDYEGSFII